MPKLNLHRKFKLFGSFIVVGILVASFQNCAGNSSLLSTSTDLGSLTNPILSFTSNGNANGYDGMYTLYGSYYSWKEGYTCLSSTGQQVSSYRSAMSFGTDAPPSGAVIVQDICSAPQVLSSMDGIETSAYLLNVIGKGPYIYEKGNGNQPDTPIQIWCRESEAFDTGLDILVRFSGNKSQGSASMIKGVLENSENGILSYKYYTINPFTVDIAYESNVINVSTSAGMQLAVQKKTSLSQEKVSGQARVVIGGVEKNLILNCRLNSF